MTSTSLVCRRIELFLHLPPVTFRAATTEPFLQAGSIRADMFQQLLVADIVIADISIHNANVFYEMVRLGVREASRGKFYIGEALDWTWLDFRTCRQRTESVLAKRLWRATRGAGYKI